MHYGVKSKCYSQVFSWNVHMERTPKFQCFWRVSSRKLNMQGHLVFSKCPTNRTPPNHNRLQRYRGDIQERILGHESIRYKYKNNILKTYIDLLFAKAKYSTSYKTIFFSKACAWKPVITVKCVKHHFAAWKLVAVSAVVFFKFTVIYEKYDLQPLPTNS